MKEKSLKSKEILRRVLSNGVGLSCYDLSRRVAADRWFLKLRLEASLPVLQDYFNDCHAEDSGVCEEIKQELGETLRFSVGKERNFIAEEEKEAVFQEMVAQVEKNMLSYIESPTFPKKLFARQFEQVKQELLVRKEHERIINMNKEADDEEPADFSGCFQD